jgi:hypothetical protein
VCRLSGQMYQDRLNYFYSDQVVHLAFYFLLSNKRILRTRWRSRILARVHGVQHLHFTAEKPVLFEEPAEFRPFGGEYYISAFAA